MKEMVLKHMGKVLCYADYVAKNRLNETVEFELGNDITSVQLDSTCIDSVWGVIESECAGKLENLKKYLADGKDIEIGQKEVIRHIMDLVELYLNNDVAIIKGHQHIKSLDDFVGKAEKLDFVSVVDTLAGRLFGDDDEAPKYVDLILDILEVDTDCLDEENKEEEE